MFACLGTENLTMRFHLIKTHCTRANEIAMEYKARQSFG